MSARGALCALEGPIDLGSWGAIREVDASMAATRIKPSRVALIGDREWAQKESSGALFEPFWADPQAAWGEGLGDLAPSWVAALGSRTAVRAEWDRAFEILRRRPRWPKIGLEKASSGKRRARAVEPTLNERPWALLSVFELWGQNALFMIHASPAIDKISGIKEMERRLNRREDARLYRMVGRRGFEGNALSLSRQLGVLALIAIKERGLESPLDDIAEARDFALFHQSFGCDLEMLGTGMWNHFISGSEARSVLARCAAMGESWELEEALRAPEGVGDAAAPSRAKGRL